MFVKLWRMDILHLEANECTIYDVNKNQKVAQVKMGKSRNFPFIGNMQQKQLWRIKLTIHRLALKVWAFQCSCTQNSISKQHDERLAKWSMQRLTTWKTILTTISFNYCMESQTVGTSAHKCMWSNETTIYDSKHIGPPSMTQSRYFILFIDDYTWMTWVYFLREKSEVFGIFKRFKAFVEKKAAITSRF